MQETRLYELTTDQRSREIMIGDLLLRYGFLSRDTIGESRCGRPIDLLSVGNRENQVLFAASFHGMESITTLLTLHFLDDVCQAVQKRECLCGIRIGSILNRRGFALVPCVNPDGVEIRLHGCESAESYQELVREVSGGDTAHWQSNAAGVDINHNFDAGWETLHQQETENGITSPAMTRYGGHHPESEPETRALASYCRTGNICHALAFHSQGEEIYWDFGNYREESAYRMAKMMAQVSGYTVSAPSGLACGGGFKDWFVEKFHRPAFTVEVGKGTNPLPLENWKDIYRDVRELMVLALVL